MALLWQAVQTHMTNAVTPTVANPEPRPQEVAGEGLIHYYFEMMSPPTVAKTNPIASTSHWEPEGSMVKWMTQKAAAMWAGFGKPSEGSWKVSYLCVQYAGCLIISLMA